MRVSKILIIDDDKVSTSLSELVIKRFNFADQVVTKSDGKEGIEYLSDVCAKIGGFPDLILLDLKMPGKDGFEFLKEFEVFSRSVNQETSVVIVTESRDPEDYIKLRNLGNYFIVNKPLTSIKLEDIFHRFFRNRPLTKDYPTC